jgi:hypothetical protein
MAESKPEEFRLPPIPWVLIILVIQLPIIVLAPSIAARTSHAVSTIVIVGIMLWLGKRTISDEDLVMYRFNRAPWLIS